MKAMRLGVLCGLIGVFAAPLGCGVTEDQPAETSSVGVAKVALIGTSRSGVTYTLTGATFQVVGPTTATLSGDEPTLSAELLPGDYTIELEPGWALSETRSDGSARPVEAELTSANPLAFNIVRSETRELGFEFRVGGEDVSLGRGTIHVGIAVEDATIDDFEDGDGEILNVGGRRGAWFTFNDGSGVQFPEPGSPVVPEPNDGGGFSLRTFGESVGAFGAGVGTNLAFAEIPLPYDASRYSGVSFRVRSNVPYRFAVGSVSTTPVQHGGSCLADCFDDHATNRGAEPAWATVEVSFAELFQLGFGTPVDLLQTELMFLKWHVPSGSAFDFELDDVKFLP